VPITGVCVRNVESSIYAVALIIILLFGETCVMLCACSHLAGIRFELKSPASKQKLGCFSPCTRTGDVLVIVIQ
jgi:hypothetical protein